MIIAVGRRERPAALAAILGEHGYSTRRVFDQRCCAKPYLDPTRSVTTALSSNAAGRLDIMRSDGQY